MAAVTCSHCGATDYPPTHADGCAVLVAEACVAMGAAIRRAVVAGAVNTISMRLESVRPDWPADAYAALDTLAAMAGGDR